MIVSNVLVILTILLSIYIAIESLCAFAKMPEGAMYFCHKTKYVLAFGSSFAFIYYAITGTERELWLAFGAAGNIAWFVWPRTIYRFQEWLEFFRKLDRMEGG